MTVVLSGEQSLIGQPFMSASALPISSVLSACSFEKQETQGKLKSSSSN